MSLPGDLDTAPAPDPSTANMLVVEPPKMEVDEFPHLSDVIWEYEANSSEGYVQWARMEPYWSTQHEVQWRFWRVRSGTADKSIIEPETLYENSWMPELPMGKEAPLGFTYDFLTTKGSRYARYYVDFSRLLQQNAATLKVRQLRRLVVSHQTGAPGAERW